MELHDLGAPNLRIDTITENVCGIINKQMELICEEFIVIENTCVITNDNYKVINIKEEKQIKVNKKYLINSDIPIVRHTHTCLLYTSRCV